jgi:hypothetical protein
LVSRDAERFDPLLQKPTFPQQISTFPPQSNKTVEKRLIHFFFNQFPPALPMLQSLCTENPIKIVLPVLFSQFIFSFDSRMVKGALAPGLEGCGQWRWEAVRIDAVV